MKIIIVILAFFVIMVTGVLAEPGVTESEIILGQSCALNGPASALGTGMKAGLLAAFEYANENGGVNGRKVKLISLDDGYEPEKTIINTKILISDEKVFMLIGQVGTPTANIAMPIAIKAKVPFFAAFTGAESLRKPVQPLIVNVRASYDQEMEKLVEYLVNKKGLTRIACFYQDDGYGQAGLSSVKKALQNHKLQLVGEGSYKRNTIAVKRGLLAIRKAEPEAVVMVGAYRPCAEFIKLAKSLGHEKILFCNISFVGTASLRHELGGQGIGCIISQVMPMPTDSSLAIIDEYNKALNKYQPAEAPDFVSLEGYVAGKLFCEIASRVKGELTRESFLEATNELKDFDLGGITMSYGTNDNQGSDAVFLTEITKDGVVQIY